MEVTAGPSKYINAKRKYFYFFTTAVVLFAGSMTVLFLLESLQGRVLTACVMVSIFGISAFKCYKVSAFSETISEELQLTFRERTDVLGIVEQKMLQNNIIQKELAELLGKLSKKQYQLQASELFKESKFNESFKALCQELERSEKMLQAQSWIVEGESKITRLLQDNLDSEIEISATKFLSQLINYIGACQGLIYQVKTDHRSERYLHRIASYAHNEESQETIAWGEGMLGHAMFDHKIQVYDCIPGEFVKINSGLGGASATSLVIVPVFHNNKPVCAIELILFRQLTQIELTFLQKVADILGGIFENMISAMKTKQLLEMSEKAAIELRENEMQLLQNKEELTAAQEQLNTKLIELQAESNLTTCIVNAINKSNASVEFDMYGQVLHANPMFLSVMGYSLEEILGKHETFMLNAQDSGSEKYDLMWQSLAQGNFITGEFIRVASSGKEVWLDATYNPIVDLEGKPYKIVMYATFTTEIKEKENDYRNKLAIINESCAFLEVTTEGLIRNSNQKFLELMKLKRKDLKGMSFKELISIKENQLNGSKIFLENYPADQALKGHLYMKDTQASLHEFQATIMANKDLDNKVIGYMVVLNPMDEVKLDKKDL